VRHLLHLACDKEFINENCYGSMPGKECVDPVFFKELEYEIARLICMAVIMNDDDSKANYDRIHAFIANVVGRSKGLHKKVCIVHGRTLKEAKYHVQTKLGIQSSKCCQTVASTICPFVLLNFEPRSFSFGGGSIDTHLQGVDS